MLNSKKLHLVLFIVTTFSIIGCDITSESIKHHINDKRLLKPGALDLLINQTYRNYKYTFLNKYKVSHDWIFIGNCYYGSVEDMTGQTIYTGNIFEKNEHTFVDRESLDYPNDSRYKYGIKNVDITKYTHSEFVNGIDSDSNPMIGKGFQPICNQSWQISQHVIEIELRKQNIDSLMSASKKSNSKLEFETRLVNGNKWQVRFSELRPAPPNGAGGPFQTWLLPIGDTGYTFIFGLGANQGSLKYPEAHAKMQAIFKHLIESVKIESVNR